MLLLLLSVSSVWAQAWKTLPKGVRIIGYRNVSTTKIDSSFDQGRSATPLGSQFRVDAATLNSLTGNVVRPGDDVNADAYNNLLLGEYKVDASAQLNVQGTGFGYGLTDRVTLYGEIAYYNAQVNTNIKRLKGNTYSDVARKLQENNSGIADSTLSENSGNLPDVSEGTIQSVITNYYGYKPLGDWYGKGYGDMETGAMIKVIDQGFWGLLVYPGVVLPTGRQDDPDILQDIAFGDGQFDLFNEFATGYIVNDKLRFGTTFRYTYQAPTSKTLRVPESRDFPLSSKKGKFDVKYGDKINFMVNSTITVNDWFSFTPVYRYMQQFSSVYTSEFTAADEFLSYNSDKNEHQLQITTSVSSIQPYLKKQFALPAQINMNIVQTVGGKNVPKAGRFELELRMLF